MKEKIQHITAAVLEEMNAKEVAFAVEYPADIAHGDYAINAALVAAKQIGKSPRDIANKLATALKEQLGESAAQVEVAGPGFVNITLSQGALLSEIEAALTAGDEWGVNNTRVGERIIIEYGNPNPFKEMHIGHLMGAIIGEAISRLVENSAATVARDTFGGDVGPHVAKALWGLQHFNIDEPASATEVGRAYIQGSRSYEKSEKAKEEIDHLNVILYEAIAKRENGKDLSDDDKHLLEVWRVGRAVSMEEFGRLYKILGTKFDYIFYDSDTTALGMDAVRDGLAKGVFEKSEGAIVYRGEKKGFHTLVFVTGHGTPTYETKDIGLAFLKEMRFPSDRSIIITANEQVGHFKVTLAALEDLAPLLAKKTVHIPHGFLRLTTGKMSSRTGNVITAAELLRDVTVKAGQKNQDPVIAEQVAVGAVKYMVLRQSPGADIIFNPEQSLSLEGDSGPYLQYALVRARSVLRMAEEAGKGKNTAALTQDSPDIPYEITRLLVRFPDIAMRGETLLAPNILVTYLTELASTWNSFYAKERIIGGTYEEHKLSLARAFMQTMQNGLTLLGIPTPDKM